MPRTTPRRKPRTLRSPPATWGPICCLVPVLHLDWPGICAVKDPVWRTLTCNCGRRVPLHGCGLRLLANNPAPRTVSCARAREAYACRETPNWRYVRVLIMTAYSSRKFSATKELIVLDRMSLACSVASRTTKDTRKWRKTCGWLQSIIVSVPQRKTMLRR